MACPMLIDMPTIMVVFCSAAVQYVVTSGLAEERSGTTCISVSESNVHITPLHRHARLPLILLPAFAAHPILVFLSMRNVREYATVRNLS